ncbi:hypothetical protein ACQR07_35680 [Bradyrhizobium sp. HKCCYLS20291]
MSRRNHGGSMGHFPAAKASLKFIAALVGQIAIDSKTPSCRRTRGRMQMQPAAGRGS